MGALRSPRGEPREPPFLSSTPEAPTILSGARRTAAAQPQCPAPVLRCPPCPGSRSGASCRAETHVEVEGIGCNINSVFGVHFPSSLTPLSSAAQTITVPSRWRLPVSWEAFCRSAAVVEYGPRKCPCISIVYTLSLSLENI